MDVENNNFTLSEDINGPLLAAVIGIEMLAGLITNSFVLILTFCYFRTERKPSTIFLTNMLLINLFIVLTAMPVSIITCATGEWIFGNTLNQKVAACQATAFVFTYSVVIATESLVLLSFDRFFFIVKAVQYEKYMTVNKAVIIVAVSWILAAILVSPPLYGFGNYRFSNSYGICVPNFRDLGFSIYGCFILFSFISSIVVTSLWTYCYTRKYIRRRNSRIFRNNVYMSQERKLIGLFGMLIVVHILCYTSMTAVSLSRPFLIVPRVMWSISFVLLLLITSLSPMVQSYFRAEIRNYICQCLIKVKIRKSPAMISRHPTQRTTVSLNQTESKAIISTPS